MHRIKFGFVVIVILLTACNAPVGPQATSTADLIATQVAILQTNMPTETIPPTLAAATTQPSATSTAQSSPVVNTPTMDATATQTAGFPDNLGQPTWRNTLDDGKLFYQYENEGTRVTVENGAMRLTGLQANDWLGWSLTYARQPQNFALQGVFITETCAGTDRYGLVFRAPNDTSGYFYGLTCEGSFELRAADFKTNQNVKLASGPSLAILSGSNQTNRLGVLVNGEKISLYVNGTLLQELSDSTFKDKGYFGAFVAANETSGFTVKMDEINLWENP